MTGGGFIVTGGVGALGRAVVQALRARGGRVAVPYRNAAAWEAEVRAAGDSAGSLWGAPADLGDVPSAARFVDDAAAWLGRVDGLACIAGAYAGSGPLEQAPVSEWDGMLRVNLQTTYAACRAALPHLLRQGGSIVTVASRVALEGGAGAAAYAVSKAAVMALTRALAAENRDRGVRVNCVVPGLIDTPDNRKAMPGADFSRWTPPEAIARVVLFLLASESGPVSGAIVPVDGRG